MGVGGASVHARLADRYGDAVGALEGSGNDAATVVALVAFLGTVAFARYVERKSRDE